MSNIKEIPAGACTNGIYSATQNLSRIGRRKLFSLILHGPLKINACALEDRYEHTPCMCLQSLNIKDSNHIEIMDVK
jgi:hypothetical protein